MGKLGLFSLLSEQEYAYFTAGLAVTAICGGVFVSRFLHPTGDGRKIDGQSADEKPSNRELRSSELGKSLSSAFTPENSDCIYLDYNATTPIYPEVSEAIIPFVTTCFGNPSSSHVYSRPCRNAIKSAREEVGRLVHASCPSKTIFFTSCGSESDNRAIDIALNHFMRRSSISTVEGARLCPRVITSAVEHPAVLLYLQHLSAIRTIDLVVLPVDSTGLVDVAQLKESLIVNTALVTIMHSNNEVGTLMPIREISAIIQEFNRSQRGVAEVLFHSDAAQSLGKVLVDVQTLGLDLLTIVGHKFGAPKGVAALYIRQGIISCPMLYGGGQEGGLRAGTESVALIAGLGAAAKLARIESDMLFLHLLTLKQRLIAGLRKAFKGIKDENFLRFNGPVRANDPEAISSDLKVLRLVLGNHNSRTRRTGATVGDDEESSGWWGSRSLMVEQLPNTVSVSFRGVDAHEVMPRLLEKVACSAGSACHSDSKAISPVLAAMAVPPEYAYGTLRLSLGRHTTPSEVDKAVLAIYNAVTECMPASH